MNVIMVGIYLDEQAEKGLLEGPLQDIIASDAPAFGLDESFAFVITSLRNWIILKDMLIRS